MISSFCFSPSPPLSFGITVTLLAAAADDDEAADAAEEEETGDCRSYAESQDIDPGCTMLPSVAPVAADCD